MSQGFVGEGFNENSHVDSHSSGRWELGSNQSVGTGSATIVTYDTNIFEDDPRADFSFNTGTGVLTVDTDGVYHIECGVEIAGNATGNRILTVHVNGTNVARQASAPNSANTWGVQCSTIYELSATDTVDARLSQNSGSALDVQADNSTFFAIRRL